MSTRITLTIVGTVLALVVTVASYLIHSTFAVVSGPTSSDSNLAGKNISHAQVTLIPINTGDPQLDKNLSSFYSCIKKAVKESKPLDTSEHNYFTSEPTKGEVTNCYNHVFR
jgi:hypothetical protein